MDWTWTQPTQIYKISSTKHDGIFIGHTIYPERRWGEHIYNCAEGYYQSNTKLYNHIRSKPYEWKHERKLASNGATFIDCGYCDDWEMTELETTKFKDQRGVNERVRYYIALLEADLNSLNKLS